MSSREPRPKTLTRHSHSSHCLMRLIPIIWTASSPTQCNNPCRNSFQDRTTSRFLYSSLLEVRSKPKRMARLASCNVIWPRWWPQTNTTSRKTTSSRSPTKRWYSSPSSCSTTNSMASNRTISTQMVSSWTISTVLEVPTRWTNSRWQWTSLRAHLRMPSSNRPCSLLSTTTRPTQSQ